MFPASVAYEFIEAARRYSQPVLGVDCFVLTESTTESPLEHILDLSTAIGIDTWHEARQFIEARGSLGFLFELTV